MSTRNDRFNRSMVSLEEFVRSFEDPSKIAAFSDGGKGVERIVGMNGKDARSPEIQRNGQDARCPSESRRAKLRAAIMRLRRANRGYLVPVLRLIVRNGNRRELSLEKMPRRTYFRHRDELLRFFSWHSTVL